MKKGEWARKLNCLFYVPDESTDAEHGVFFVGFAKSLEDGFHLCVVNDGEDSGIHGGPGVRTQMGITCLAATALHLFPSTESSGIGTTENGLHVLCLCLVECYKN